MSKQFYNNIAPIQPGPGSSPAVAGYYGASRAELRERERVNPAPELSVRCGVGETRRVFVVGHFKTPFLTALFCIGELPIVT